MRSEHFVMSVASGILVLEPLTDAARIWCRRQGDYLGRMFFHGCLIAPYDHAQSIRRSASRAGLHRKIGVGLCPVCHHSGSDCTARR